MKPKLAIIIPAYNEELALPKTLEEFKIHLPAILQHLSELCILVVNDGSLDSTASVASRFSSQIPLRILDLPINLGIGGAVQTGFQYANENGFDYALQFDADGQHPINHIPDLLAQASKHQTDIVVGSRFLHTKEERAFTSTPMRLVGISWLRFLIRACTRTRATDPTSGFRLMSKRLISIFSEHYPSDYPEPETLAFAITAGFSFAEIPVLMRARQAGQSSISPLKTIYYLFKVSMAVIFGSLEGRMFIKASR